MKTNLIALRICNWRGENVETFSKKVSELVKRIQGSGVVTVDIYFLVIGTFL